MKAVKAYDIDAMIGTSVGLHGWEQTINEFTGKKVEFRYLPDRYDGSMGDRILASSNSAATCPVDESTFLKVQSRHSRFIVIRGVIAPFSVDTQLKLNDCDVVQLDTEGWEPDPFEGQNPTPRATPVGSQAGAEGARSEDAATVSSGNGAIRYDSFKTEVFGGGNVAAPILTGGNPPNKDYKAALNEAVMDDPVYAGSYSVARLGCGNACEFIKFVNQANGVVVDLPSELQGNAHDIAHLVNSSLIKVTTYLNPDMTKCRFDDLVIENDRFRSVATRSGTCPNVAD